MDNPVDQQRLDEYQKRVADWISKQGIFFQMRYAGTLGGGSIVRQLGILLLRILVICVLLIGVAFFFLNHHFSSESYREKVTAELGEVLGAESTKSKKFERARGVSTFQDLVIEGGEESFFYSAVIDRLTASSNFLTGITSKWAPKQVRLKSAYFNIKAGGDLDEMTKSFASVVESMSEGELESIEIEDLSCDWGYSKITYGRLEKVDFRAVRDGGVWKISLEGGRYSQNWLKGFDIEKATLVCGKNGLTVDELVLSKNGGELELAGTIKGPASRPNFDLEGTFKSLPVLSLLRVPGIDIREYMSGSISGDLRIFGSTDHRVIMEGDVKLGEGDMITLREKWELLRAISVLDVDRTYRRVDFEEGEFSFKTEKGGIEIKGINIKAGTQASLRGDLKTYLPTQKEAAEALGIVLTEGIAGGFSSDSTDTSAAKSLEDERMSLKGAAGLLGGNEDQLNLGGAGSSALSRAQKGTLTEEEMDDLRMRQEMNIYRVTGDLSLGVGAVVFSENDNLKKMFPVNDQGWRWIHFTVKSALTNVSSKIAEEVLEEARRFEAYVEDE